MVKKVVRRAEVRGDHHRFRVSGVLLIEAADNAPLIRYRRCQRRLRNIEAVIESVQDGRVHPVFSQTRTDHCRLSCIKPRLLDGYNIKDLRSCLPESLGQLP